MAGRSESPVRRPSADPATRRRPADEPPVDAIARNLGNQAVARLAAAHRHQRTLARFAPTAGEQARTTAALDTLLGHGVDPNGIRAALTAAATSLAALEAATVAVTAAAGGALRLRLLTEVGNVETVRDLLAACTHPAGLGTPAPRLARILDETNALPRTVAALQPHITAALAFEEKVLRGRPDALAAGVDARGGAGTLIGGHSAAILTAPGYAVAQANVAAANGTQVATFYRLLRNDGGVAATAIVNAAAPTIVDAARNLAVRAHQLAKGVAPPAVPADLATRPAAAQAFWTVKQNGYNTAMADVVRFHAAAIAQAIAVTAAAQQAALQPADTGRVRTFADAVDDLVANARSAAAAAKVVAAALGPQMPTQALALTAAADQFAQFGPAVSTKKVSTLAPAAWSDDEILQAGHETAQVTPTLVSHAGSPARPGNGAQIRTKHQKVVNGVAWIAMKDGVTFTDGAPPTFAGGRLISSFPTQSAAIPAPPAPNTADDDGFYVL
jgi:hypothetical protein